MGLKSFFTKVHLFLLVPLALISTTYLYLYPFWHHCSFPSAESATSATSNNLAPLRLLTLADPQLEGDTSLKRYHRSRQKHRRDPQDEDVSVLESIRAFMDKDQMQELSRGYLAKLLADLMYFRKKLDLWGNDLYLAHVYRTMRLYTNPTHTVVLGDLVGSQWITDEEFEKRGRRFWDIVFRGAEKVTEEDVKLNEEVMKKVKETVGKEVGEMGVNWGRKIMNVVGNHDVGYAGDMRRQRVDRFEKMFGPVNYMLNWYPPPNPATGDFTSTNLTANTNLDEDEPDVNEPPVLRIVLLNSLTLDTPITDRSLADDTFATINTLHRQRTFSPHQATLLLTHLPFHKREGVCADPPFIDYFPDYQGGGVREQNHLSDTSSALLLGWLFGLPQGSDSMRVRRKEKGLILTGHDHVGCDVWHYYRQIPKSEDYEEDELDQWGREKIKRLPTGEWDAVGWEGKESMELGMRMAGVGAGLGEEEGGFVFEGVREVTVRSMMGDFGGNAGLVSVWWDWDEMAWRFRYSTCSLGVQHIWWAVHVIDLISLISTVILALWHIVGSTRKPTVVPEKKTQ